MDTIVVAKTCNECPLLSDDSMECRHPHAMRDRGFAFPFFQWTETSVNTTLDARYPLCPLNNGNLTVQAG